MAASAATVSELVRYIRRVTGTDAPGQGRIQVRAYMSLTFGIPLATTASLGAWVGFADGDGHLCDSDLDELLGECLRPQAGC